MRSERPWPPGWREGSGGIRPACRGGWYPKPFARFNARHTGQTAESLRRSIDFCTQAGVCHISAYLLKIEEGTPFAQRRASLVLPNEDTVCDLYEQACEELEAAGFQQYEISNFARHGFESRHNLKYWNAEEYLGLGASAHSFLGGKRFFYPRDRNAFLRGEGPIQDGEGGSFEEYAMLRMRLADGLIESLARQRYGCGIPPTCGKAPGGWSNMA